MSEWDMTEREKQAFCFPACDMSGNEAIKVQEEFFTKYHALLQSHKRLEGMMGRNMLEVKVKIPYSPVDVIYTVNSPLDVDRLADNEKIPPGAIFSRGVAYDNRIDQERLFAWVAVRGANYEYVDWSIYYDIATMQDGIISADFGVIALHGIKIFTPSVIEMLVPCTNEALLRYRR